MTAVGQNATNNGLQVMSAVHLFADLGDPALHHLAADAARRWDAGPREKVRPFGSSPKKLRRQRDSSSTQGGCHIYLALISAGHSNLLLLVAGASSNAKDGGSYIVYVVLGRRCQGAGVHDT